VHLLCILDYNGGFNQVNPAWEQLLGYSTEELMARPFAEFSDPADRAATWAATGSVMQGQRISWSGKSASAPPNWPP
jgi:PAS domain S-box-containing protein